LSPTLEADSPTDTCTVRAEISIERLNSQLREPSPEPDSGFQWGESARRSLGALTFAEQLAETIQRAPERRAERLADQLKEICVEEASMGLNSCTWDVPIPSSSRSFVNQVAREFAFNVETMGFERIEWWNGREWKQSQGRYHILHDTVYDKIHMRLRVRWPDRLQATLRLYSIMINRMLPYQRHRLLCRNRFSKHWHCKGKCYKLLWSAMCSSALLQRTTFKAQLNFLASKQRARCSENCQN